MIYFWTRLIGILFGSYKRSSREENETTPGGAVGAAFGRAGGVLAYWIFVKVFAPPVTKGFLYLVGLVVLIVIIVVGVKKYRDAVENNRVMKEIRHQQLAMQQGFDTRNDSVTKQSYGLNAPIDDELLKLNPDMMSDAQPQANSTSGTFGTSNGLSGGLHYLESTIPSENPSLKPEPDYSNMSEEDRFFAELNAGAEPAPTRKNRVAAAQPVNDDFYQPGQSIFDE